MQAPSNLRYLTRIPCQKLSRESLATAEGRGNDVELQPRFIYNADNLWQWKSSPSSEVAGSSYEVGSTTKRKDANKQLFPLCHQESAAEYSKDSISTLGFKTQNSKLDMKLTQSI